MSTTKEQLDALTQKLTELQTTVKEHAKSGDTATLDMDALEIAVKGIVDEQAEARAKEEKDKTPIRKGDFIGPDGFKAKALGDVEEGKFIGAKMSDVAFAAQFLRQANALAPAHAKLPSDYTTKLLDATTAGAGDEYVPTALAAELWQDFFLQSKVVGALGGGIAMPTDPWENPLSWGSIVWRKGRVGEASDAQNPATAKSTFTATEQVAEINWAYDLDEDGIVAVMPTLRQELVRSGVEQMDAFVLNADSTASATGNINLDDATPATDAYYLSNGQDGIRHYYLVDQTGQSTDASAALTDAIWIAAHGRMGKYGVDPSQVVAITNIKTYLLSILGLTNVRTLDKYGPQATVITGELAKMGGVPIIVSESMPLAEDDGKVSNTAASNDEGQIAFVNRSSWKVGFKRQLMIEVDRDIQKRMFIMVVSFKIAVAARNRTDTHTAGVHGITY